MTREREIAYIALIAALIVVLRFVPAIALPVGVPITAQSLGVMLAGTLLGARYGFFAVLIVVGLGLLGLPVFASGAAGLAIFTAPTVGFILGFPIAALVTGVIAQKLSAVPVFGASATGAVIGSILVLYGLGILGLALVTSMGIRAAVGAMLPFVPGDLIKALIAGFLTATLYKLRPEWVLTR